MFASGSGAEYLAELVAEVVLGGVVGVGGGGGGVDGAGVPDDVRLRLRGAGCGASPSGRRRTHARGGSRRS